MIEKIKKAVVLIIGWGFLGLGVLGLFLPFLQGILFIMVGIAILSTRSEKINRLLNHLEKRHPQYHERIAHWRQRVNKWFR